MKQFPVTPGSRDSKEFISTTSSIARKRRRLSESTLQRPKSKELTLVPLLNLVRAEYFSVPHTSVLGRSIFRFKGPSTNSSPVFQNFGTGSLLSVTAVYERVPILLQLRGFIEIHPQANTRDPRRYPRMFCFGHQ
jgi:hypothetical protein